MRVPDEVHARQAAAINNEMGDEVFIELLDYEIQNRAFALDSIVTLVKGGEQSNSLLFFRAYLKLEQLNQQRFTPIAKKYQLDMAPRWWTRRRAQLVVWTAALLPETLFKTMHKATVKYVARLQELERLSPDHEKAFFRYVVAQEQAQASALGLLVAGKPEQATAILIEFVKQNQI